MNIHNNRPIPPPDQLLQRNSQDSPPRDALVVTVGTGLGRNYLRWHKSHANRSVKLAECGIDSREEQLVCELSICLKKVKYSERRVGLLQICAEDLKNV
jgi:hypothetical protein